MTRRFSLVSLTAGLGFVAVLPLTGIGQPAQAQESREHQIAAAMVYNFARFTTWLDTPVPAGAAFTICVPEDAPIFPALADLEDRTIKDRPVRVTSAFAEGSGCQIKILDGQPVDDPTPQPGTMYIALDQDQPDADIASLTLVRVGRQIRFIADTRAAARCGLQLSSKLLDLAVRVR